MLSDRRAKQAMEVVVTSPGGKAWKAYPKMYMNARTNQMMANPDVRSTPMMDLYLSPQAYDPGSPAHMEGTRMTLRKGESKTAFGVNLRFLDFSADRSQLQSDRPRVVITSQFLVTTAKASAEKTARFTMFMGGAGGQNTEAPDVAIPDTPGRFHVTRVSPSDGAIDIEVLGLDPKGDMKPATPEQFTMDVTTKPLISLVWAGFYVMMAGGLLALLRRGKDAHAATLA